MSASSSPHRRKKGTAPSGRSRGRRRQDRAAAEWLLTELAEQWQPPQRILCLSLGRGGVAAHAAELFPDARIVVYAGDIFDAERIADHLQPYGERVDVVCRADLPSGPFELFLLPTDRHGDAELTRDMIQSGLAALSIGGRIVVSTNNPRDTWLGNVLKTWLPKFRRFEFTDGVVYSAVKHAEPVKYKNFVAETAFRDGPRLITVISRPGVFCHRRVDAGARALIRSLDAASASDRSVLQPTDRVLELGCGSGAVSFAAAIRVPQGSVLAVDSNARAVECTRLGAERNGLHNVTALLNADGDLPPSEPFDCVLANPPYFSNYRIAEQFVATAERLLTPNGRLHVVTKSPRWFLQRCATSFDEVTQLNIGEYAVVVAQRPQRSTSASGPASASKQRRGRSRSGKPRGEACRENRGKK